MQKTAINLKKPFVYKDRDGKETLLVDMKTEELQFELEFTRKRKVNIEFIERKLETELMKRLKNEPTPTQVIIRTTNKAIG